MKKSILYLSSLFFIFAFNNCAPGRFQIQKEISGSSMSASTTPSAGGAQPAPGSPSPATSTISSKDLMWAPPLLVNPKTIILKSSTDASVIELDKAQDYILVCDPFTKGRIKVRNIKIEGGHHLVMKGCLIERQENTANSVYPPVDGKCENINNPVGTFRISKHTGIAYIEGVIVDLQNTTTNYHNYGVDAIDVGDSQAYLNLSIGGTVVEEENIGLEFYHEDQILGSLVYKITPSMKLDDLAEGIANALNSNAVLSQSPAGILATANSNTVHFQKQMPDGNRTRIAISSFKNPDLIFSLNNKSGFFRGSSYVFQNVRSENMWSTQCGHHADALQAQAEVHRLYLDHFTTRSGYQGLQLQQSYSLFDVQFRNVNATYMNNDYSKKNSAKDTLGANGYAWWMGTGLNPETCENCVFKYQIYNSYAEERINMGKLQWSGSSVAPASHMPYGNSPLEGDVNKAQFIRPSGPNVSMTGYISKGIPPGGDFVPRDLIVNSNNEVIYKPATSFQSKLDE